MAEYATAAGFIQFPVNEKEVNGKDLREFTIRTTGSQKLVKITLWPEWAHVDVEEGDFVVADGKYESSLGQGKNGAQIEYQQITPYKLVVTKGEKPAERETVVRKAPKSEEPLF